MPRTRHPLARLLATLLLHALALSGGAAAWLDAAEAPRPAAAWEAEHHAAGCPTLHDHATCRLLQEGPWLPAPGSGSVVAHDSPPASPRFPAEQPPTRAATPLLPPRAPPAI